MASLTDTDSPAPTSSGSERAYQVYHAARIAVAKSAGTVWKARRDASTKKRQQMKLDKAWEEAARYYANDQLPRRESTPNDYGPNASRLVNRIILEFAETENFVFANTVAAVPAIYSKNPTCEINSYNPDLEPILSPSERLINALFAKREPPGVNIKPKARRAIVACYLTNQGWLEVGWIKREESTDEAMIELDRLAQQLEKAENGEEVKEIEGRLQALEMSFAMLDAPGPFVKYRPPDAILRDTASVEEDLSDAAWVMCYDMMSTALLKARYFREGSDESIYEPTHHVPTGSAKDDIHAQVETFSIFDSGKSYTEMGYSNETEYNECLMTKVWWVWDKTTRRVYLFHDKNWSWPIWVWNDPYKLTTFFPYVPINFYTSMQGGETKGEVTYWLDQQDAINYNNSVKHAIKAWAGTKIGYDSNMLKQHEAERFIQSNKLEVIPFNVPEGAKLEDILPRALQHPATGLMQLFDNGPSVQAIDRLSIVSDVLRGAQYKTNTTNQAIGQYQQTQQTKHDAINDQVEDAIGIIAYMLLQMCWRFMDQQTVMELIGEAGAQWRNLSDAEIKAISVRVEGGTMQKPNSKWKQEQAIQLGQVLGQFAGATPAVVVVVLKLMERAFDDLLISPEDWQMITQSLAPEQPEEAAPPEGDTGESGLPPEAEQAYNEMVQQGVPPEVAAERIQAALQGEMQ